MLASKDIVIIRLLVTYPIVVDLLPVLLCVFVVPSVH
jgi:hypothetical protein